MTLGFLSGSKNFWKFIWVSFEVSVLRGHAWIHWVAKSYTMTACRWLFRDSQLSLRTLWSADIKSPKFSAYSCTIASSALGPCNFGPLTDLAISVFREHQCWGAGGGGWATRPRRGTSVVDWFSHVSGLQQLDWADAGRQAECGWAQEPRGAMRHTLHVLLQDVRDTAKWGKTVLAWASVGCVVSWPQFRLWNGAERWCAQDERRDVSISFGKEQYREGILVRVSLSECIIEELGKRCYNKGGQARNHMKNFVVAVLKGLKREVDSVKAICSMEVSVICEEPTVLELDEYAEKPQNVFGVSIPSCWVRRGRSRSTSWVSWRCTASDRRSWAMDKGTHVIPTKWVDVNRSDDKRPEYRSRLCGEELKRWDPTMPGTCASMGPFECVMFLLPKALMWKPGKSVATSRKILFLDERGHISQA